MNNNQILEKLNIAVCYDCPICNSTNVSTLEQESEHLIDCASCLYDGLPERNEQNSRVVEEAKDGIAWVIRTAGYAKDFAQELQGLIGDLEDLIASDEKIDEETDYGLNDESNEEDVDPTEDDDEEEEEDIDYPDEEEEEEDRDAKIERATKKAIRRRKDTEIALEETIDFAKKAKGLVDQLNVN